MQRPEGVELPQTPDLGRQRYKLVAAAEIQRLKGVELPDLGRQRRKLFAGPEIQRLEAGERSNCGQ